MTRFNMNDLARRITLKEGGKKQISIAQVKEVIKLVMQDLNDLSDDEIIKVVRRHKH
jgi:hypothetical protein